MSNIVSDSSSRIGQTFYTTGVYFSLQFSISYSMRHLRIAPTWLWIIIPRYSSYSIFTPQNSYLRPEVFSIKCSLNFGITNFSTDSFSKCLIDHTHRPLPKYQLNQGSQSKAGSLENGLNIWRSSNLLNNSWNRQQLVSNLKKSPWANVHVLDEVGRYKLPAVSWIYFRTYWNWRRNSWYRIVSLKRFFWAQVRPGEDL